MPPLIPVSLARETGPMLALLPALLLAAPIAAQPADLPEPPAVAEPAADGDEAIVEEYQLLPEDDVAEEETPPDAEPAPLAEAPAGEDELVEASLTDADVTSRGRRRPKKSGSESGNGQGPDGADMTEAERDLLARLDPRMRRRMEFEEAKRLEAEGAGAGSRPAGLRRPDADDGAGDIDAAEPAVRPPVRRSRSRAIRAQNRIFDQPPAVASEVRTNIGRYRVRKKFGGGAVDGVYLMEATAPDARRGQLSVLKHAAPIVHTDDNPNSDLFEVIRFQRDRRAALTRNNALRRLGEPLDDVADVPFVETDPVAFQRALTAHEVSMQNQVVRATRGADRVLPATQMSGNRIKMPYSGATSGDVAAELNEMLRAGTIDARLYRAAMQKITRETLEVAAAIGDAGVVHRDLKMDNLTIGSDGRMRAIDFGLAKRAGESDRDVLLRTGSGYNGLGVPEYQAPEARETGFESGRMQSSHKSDVYYAGMAIKQRALKREIDPRNQNAQDPALEQLASQATKGKPLDRVLNALTQPDVSKRPTAREALANRRNWERFSGKTQADADDLLLGITRRQINRQTGAPQSLQTAVQ